MACPKEGGCIATLIVGIMIVIVGLMAFGAYTYTTHDMLWSDEYETSRSLGINKVADGYKEVFEGDWCDFSFGVTGVACSSVGTALIGLACASGENSNKVIPGVACLVITAMSLCCFFIPFGIAMHDLYQVDLDYNWATHDITLPDTSMNADGYTDDYAAIGEVIHTDANDVETKYLVSYHVDLDPTGNPTADGQFEVDKSWATADDGTQLKPDTKVLVNNEKVLLSQVTWEFGKPVSIDMGDGVILDCSELEPIFSNDAAKEALAELVLHETTYGESGLLDVDGEYALKLDNSGTGDIYVSTSNGLSAVDGVDTAVEKPFKVPVKDYYSEPFLLPEDIDPDKGWWQFQGDGSEAGDAVRPVRVPQFQTDALGTTATIESLIPGATETTYAQTVTADPTNGIQSEAFTLPPDMDPSQVEWKFENGNLVRVLPSAETVARRRLPEHRYNPSPDQPQLSLNQVVSLCLIGLSSLLFLAIVYAVFKIHKQHHRRPRFYSKSTRLRSFPYR